MLAKPGQPERYDNEYKRNGVVNLFGLFEPLAGWRQMSVTDTRTVDFAHQMKALVDINRPDADCIRLVVDNLNTHHPATLYEAFPAEEANRILKKLEFHYTPKHASWLNQVGIEFSVLSRQCLDRQKAIYLESNHYDALIHLTLLKQHRGALVGAAVLRRRIQRLQKL